MLKILQLRRFQHNYIFTWHLAVEGFNK